MGGNPFVRLGVVRPSRLSARGATFIANFEGFVARPYNDGASNATIGYGHLLHMGPVNELDRERWPKPITRDYALSLLRRDADVASAAVRTYITTRLTQAQFDALCSFAFNCGAGALRATEVAHVVNARMFSLVPEKLARWVHDSRGVVEPGLVTRRRAEGVLFTTGRY